MPKIRTSIFILALLVCTVAYAAESDSSQKGNTHQSDSSVSVPVSIMFTQRAISGDLAVDPSGPPTGPAKRESLGLDKATSVQFAFAVNWKKWNFGFTYLPSTFTGDGYSEERLDYFKEEKDEINNYSHKTCNLLVCFCNCTADIGYIGIF